jgi:hypothetical protein
MSQHVDDANRSATRTTRPHSATASRTDHRPLPRRRWPPRYTLPHLERGAIPTRLRPGDSRVNNRRQPAASAALSRALDRSARQPAIRPRCSSPLREQGLRQSRALRDQSARPTLGRSCRTDARAAENSARPIRDAHPLACQRAANLVRLPVLQRGHPMNCCAQCNGPIIGRRSDARYCSDRCRSYTSQYARNRRCIDCGATITASSKGRCLRCRPNPSPRRWTAELILNTIRKFVETHDRVPRSVEWGHGTMPTKGALRREFPGVAPSDVIRLAGFDPRPHGVTLTATRSERDRYARNRQMVTGKGLADNLPGTVKHFGSH